MRIIPAIDLINGKCVRLSKGDYSTKKIYSENPLEVAKAFQDHGITSLHLVDLDGAKAGKIINYATLERIAVNTKLSIDFGGGLKSDEDLKIAFESGAQQITGGSIAVKDPDRFETWLKIHGSDKIILGADARNGMIAVSGWQETSSQKLIPFVDNFVTKGVKYVICTDISKDGMLSGPSGQLYKEMIKTIPEMSLIASGGISCMEELPQLQAMGCEGTIIGKAIYENRIGLKDLEQFILNN